MEEKEELNLYQKLLEIQTQLKAPKGQYNDFGGYKYRSCEDILESLKPLLLKYNVTLILEDEIEAINNRYYIKAKVQLINIADGKIIQTTALARESEAKKGMDDSQITGTASSYARKYALNGLFCIDDTKDADSSEYKNELDNKNDKTSTTDKNKTVTLASAKAYKFKSGKYKGQTIAEVALVDTQYINYLYANTKNATIKKYITLIAKEQKEKNKTNKGE